MQKVMSDRAPGSIRRKDPRSKVTNEVPTAPGPSVQREQSVQRWQQFASRR